jgi:hypothetical protein
MGENTTANSDHSLSTGKYNDVNTSNSGDTDILLVAGNGEELNRSDALVLDKDGNLSISGVFEGGPTGNTFAGHFQGNKNQTDAGGPDSHVAFVENTNTGFSASGLAIQTGGSDPGPVGGNNFLTFYGGGGDPVGAVDGNGTGGVSFKSGGADYAEELPVAEGTPTPEPTELVGVRAGTIRLATDNATQVLIASSAPAVTGNTTPANTADDAGRVPVAFVGQVPVKVRGAVQIGDLIVASEQNDGTARAVAPSQYRHAEHGPVAGQAWSAKDAEEVGTVTAAVGLGSAGRAAAKRLEKQQEQIDTLRKRVQKMEVLETRLAEVEAQVSGGGSLIADLSGSSLLAGIFLLLGTGLGVGLRWRSRQ